MGAREHGLFQEFPLSGSALLSTGIVPTPYHVYDGHGVFIGGSADLPATRDLLAAEQVVPVRDAAGRAAMGVWVFDFTEASLGPHHELQLSIFVAPSDAKPIGAHPLGLIEAMIDRPDVQMLCHGLWNSTPAAVAYNRELLALNARRSDSLIERDGKELRFCVTDRATQAPVLSGRIEQSRRGALRAGWDLMRRVGLRRLVSLAAQPWIRLPVINPVGAVLGRNAAADSYTKAAASRLRPFDARGDAIDFGDERYRRLGFEPSFVQAMEGFRFVYLFPG